MVAERIVNTSYIPHSGYYNNNYAPAVISFSSCVHCQSLHVPRTHVRNEGGSGETTIVELRQLVFHTLTFGGVISMKS